MAPCLSRSAAQGAKLHNQRIHVRSSIPHSGLLGVAPHVRRTEQLGHGLVARVSLAEIAPELASLAIGAALGAGIVIARGTNGQSGDGSLAAAPSGIMQPDQSEQLRVELEQLRAQLSAQSKALAAAETAAAGASQARADAAARESEAGAARRDAAAAERRAEAIAAEVDAAKLAVSAATDKAAGLEARVAALSGQLSSASGELKALRASAGKQLSQLQAALQASQAAAKQAAADLEAAEAGAVRARTEMAAANAAAARAQSEVATLTKQVRWAAPAAAVIKKHHSMCLCLIKQLLISAATCLSAHSTMAKCAAGGHQRCCSAASAG